MAAQTLYLNDALYDYMRANACEEPPFLKTLSEQTARLPNGQMQIAPEQGQFLFFLMRAMQVRTALEVGTFTGYSAAWMALALPADGHLVCCERDPEPLVLAKAAWAAGGVSDRITVRLGSAEASLLQLTEEAARFDFAFIDADKPKTPIYLEAIFPLLNAGGVIAVDNLFREGEVLRESPGEGTRTMRDFLKARQTDVRFDMSLIPIGDGVLLLRKREI